MTIRHVVQSLLVRQFMAAGAEWGTKYPTDWLVWDANAVSVPFAPEQLRVTQLPDPTTRVTKFNLQRATFAEDRPIQLTSGDRITLGGVKLTFLDAKGMRALVELEANGFARP